MPATEPPTPDAAQQAASDLTEAIHRLTGVDALTDTDAARLLRAIAPIIVEDLAEVADDIDANWQPRDVAEAADQIGRPLGDRDLVDGMGCRSIQLARAIKATHAATATPSDTTHHGLPTCPNCAADVEYCGACGAKLED